MLLSIWLFFKKKLLFYGININRSLCMKQTLSFLMSTIGQKILMALTGLLLIGFLLVHLSGNFLLFDCFGGQDEFNAYSHRLANHPLLIPAEITLLVLLITHIISAIRLSILSKRSRPKPYAIRRSLGNSSLASRTMLQTGSLIFIFLLFHLLTFKWGEEIHVQGGKDPSPMVTETASHSVQRNHAPIRDLYRTVVTNFAKPWYSLLYIISMMILGFHLSHALHSACQSLGLSNPGSASWIRRLSIATGVFFAVAYSAFPIYFCFIHPVSF